MGCYTDPPKHDPSEGIEAIVVVTFLEDEKKAGGADLVDLSVILGLATGKQANLQGILGFLNGDEVLVGKEIINGASAFTALTPADGKQSSLLSWSQHSSR